jgi:hypothetical protein
MSINFFFYLTSVPVPRDRKNPFRLSKSSHWPKSHNKSLEIIQWLIHILRVRPQAYRRQEHVKGVMKLRGEIGVHHLDDPYERLSKMSA